MKKLISTLFICNSILLHSFADNTIITWLQPKNIELTDIELNECQTLIKRLGANETEHLINYQRNENDVLHKIIYHADVNNDGIQDYWVIYRGSGFCGTNGCAVDFFLSEGNNQQCSLISFPNIRQEESPLGIDEMMNVYYINEIHRKEELGGRCKTLIKGKLNNNSWAFSSIQCLL